MIKNIHLKPTGNEKPDMIVRGITKSRTRKKNAIIITFQECLEIFVSVIKQGKDIFKNATIRKKKIKIIIFANDTAI